MKDILKKINELQELVTEKFKMCKIEMDYAFSMMENLQILKENTQLALNDRKE